MTREDRERGGEGTRWMDLHVFKITHDLSLYSLSKAETPSARRGSDAALRTMGTYGPSIRWGGKQHLRP